MNHRVQTHLSERKTEKSCPTSSAGEGKITGFVSCLFRGGIEEVLELIFPVPSRPFSSAPEEKCKDRRPVYSVFFSLQLDYYIWKVFTFSSYVIPIELE